MLIITKSNKYASKEYIKHFFETKSFRKAGSFVFYVGCYYPHRFARLDLKINRLSGKRVSMFSCFHLLECWLVLGTLVIKNNTNFLCFMWGITEGFVCFMWGITRRLGEFKVGCY